MRTENWLRTTQDPNKRLESAELALTRFLKSINRQVALLVFWEIEWLQSMRGLAPSVIKGLPSGGLGTSHLDGGAYISPWVVEQTVNLLCIYGAEHSPRSSVDIKQWNNIAKLCNLIREYNDARSAVFLKTGDVFETLSKIGRQQFPWQGGAFGLHAMELYTSIYSGENCRAACNKEHGLEISDILSYGFIILSQFYSQPTLKLPYNMDLLGGEHDKLTGVMKRFSTPMRNVGGDCRRLRKNDLLGEYSKSLFRMTPILKLANKDFFCPIPKLIQFRITSGLVSDTSFGSEAINEVGVEFENYCARKFTIAFKHKKVAQEEKYGSRQKPKKTPDLRTYDQGRLRLIIECKATLMRFEDKFVNLDLNKLPKKSDQIVKGILQIWRYVRDIHEGKAPDKIIHEKCHGLILTLEEWVVMDKARHELLIEAAHKIAEEEKIPDISRIHILITSIKDVWYVLEHANFDELMVALDMATSPDFNGYLLQNVFKKHFGDMTKKRDILSFEVLNENIWYWKDLDKLQEGL